MKKRNVCVLLAAALSCSLVLTACGGDTTTSTPGGGTSTPSSASTSTGASSPDTSGTASGYTFRTSESNRVVTENGTFTSDQVTEPILITSFHVLYKAILSWGKSYGKNSPHIINTVRIKLYK